AMDDGAFLEILHQLLPLLGTRFFKDGAARNNNVSAPTIHFQDLELLRHIHQRSDVADRPDIDLGSWKESHGAIEIDCEAALDLIEDDTLNFFSAVECLLQFAPAFLAPCLVAGQYSLAERILDSLEIDFYLIADLKPPPPSPPAPSTHPPPS